MIVFISKIIIPVITVLLILGLVRAIHRHSLSIIFYGILLAILFYGMYTGLKMLNIRHEQFASDELPLSFDGYTIVHISDLHVGTYSKDATVLDKAIDSINALRPDLIIFTGDIQNISATEIAPHAEKLASLKAKDGVFSILGNHDYADYLKGTKRKKADAEHLTQLMEQRMGWTLLKNTSMTIPRGNDTIVIAGMENDGDGKRFRSRGNISKTLKGINPQAFVIMAQHDPSSWRRNILPNSNAQLTLSGHTHATQIVIGGWSPAKYLYSEWGGMYYEGKRAINVSTGLGGFIPFRLGVPPEITIITLRSTH